MKDIALDKIVDEIRSRREKEKISQITIANDLGISLRSYQNYEYKDKQIPSDILLKLCYHFRIDLNEYLLTGEIVDLIEEVKIHNIEQKLDLLLDKMDTKFAEFKKELTQELIKELSASRQQERKQLKEPDTGENDNKTLE
ncbi:MAG: helix-turn-helix transcriptional regulator [Bacteroidia bacterium]|nr:helix-turn-helix transcriptional regulator [Bacteroidia bacterium]